MPRIPTFFVPRDYQLPVWQALVEKRTHKRAALVWPRRAGKDLTALNIIAYHALAIRPGNYYYFLPSYTQGEKIIWDGKTKDGKSFLDVFPEECIDSVDNRKMKLKLTNGSLFQVVGASEQDSVVGTNPVGCVFSEYSIQSPKFWDYIRPILLENEGIALFTYTARGLNHGWRLYESTKNNPKWFTEFRTAETVVHNGKRMITEDMIDEERRSGMVEELVRQEFYNDFYASNVGAYYSKEMQNLHAMGRINKEVVWKPNLPVHTAWDIGRADATAIWFFQVDTFGNIALIDSYSNTGEGLLHYLRYLKSKPYVYGDHFGPHDMKVHEFTTNQSRLEVALQHGVRFTVVPKLSIADGIDAARRTLPRCLFNEEKCFNGLEALRQYCKDESGLVDMAGRPIFRDQPKHDWTSHFADSFRYLSVAVEKVVCHNGYVTENGQIVDLPDSTPDFDVHSF